MNKVHFIGIAGIGMSATAVLMKEKGWYVTGSDEKIYSPSSDYLFDHKIPVAIGYKKENIPADADLFIIGRNAKLDPQVNGEVKAALATGKPIKSFPEIIGDLAKDTENIVVAGSYGKSTCAALLTWILKQSGKNPNFFIGAMPANFKETAHIGEKNNLFIIEGDEYPTSHTDPRPKFAHFRPHDALLTSAEHDHFNVYHTIEAYLEPFKHLLAESSKDGIIVAGIDNPHVEELIVPYKNRVCAYGLGGNSRWSAKNIKYGEKTSFDLVRQEGEKVEKIIELSTQLLGKHNIENIVGVSALILEKDLATPEEIKSAIASFKGLYRRLDRKDKNSSVPVYEGFGSSYEKARSAIDAMKIHFPDKRLVLIFEPHTFSWRNRETISWYDDVFDGADKIFVFEPYGQGAQTHQQLSHEEIIERIEKAGFNVSPFDDSQNSLNMISSYLRENDVVLILTSGDMGGMIKTIVKNIEKKFVL